MNRTVKMIGVIFLAAALLGIGSDGTAPAAQNGNPSAPEAAASPASSAPTMGPGMMGGAMMGGGTQARHYQIHRGPCPCAQNQWRMRPEMMGHPMMHPEMMARTMGSGMMAGGEGAAMMWQMDPKTRGKIMQLRGKYMIEMGQLLERRGKELEAGK